MEKANSNEYPDNNQSSADIKPLSIARKMSSFIGSIEHYLPGDDIAEYIDRFEEFCKCNEISETKKSSLLITLVGPEAYKTMKTVLAPESPTTKPYQKLVETLKKVYAPKKLVIVERFNFFKRKQKENESVTEYVVSLKLLACHCNFGAFLDQALRDKFVFGLYNSKWQEKLLEDDSTTFEQVCSKALSLETLSKQSNSMKPTNINAVNSKNSATSSASQSRAANTTKFNKQQSSTASSSHRSQTHQNNSRGDDGKFVCSRCGNTSHKTKCPAINVVCHNCKTKGHFSKMCRRRGKVNNLSSSSSSLVTSSKEKPSECAKEVCSSIHSLREDRRLIVPVEVEDFILDMEVDSGASQSVISYVDFCKYLKEIKLESHKVTLQVVTGQQVAIVGKVDVGVKWPSVGGGRCVLELVVIKAEKCFIPIMVRSVVAGHFVTRLARMFIKKF